MSIDVYVNIQAETMKVITLIYTYIRIYNAYLSIVIGARFTSNE